MRQRIGYIAIGLILTTFLGYFFAKDRGWFSRVDAAGDLSITYNNLPVSFGPIFSVQNMLPGDCEVRTVTVDNGGTQAALVAVKSQNENNPDNLASVLSMVISSNGSDLYGGTHSSGPKKVQDFFTQSAANLDGIPLTSVAPAGTTTYDFQVCMDNVGNEFQNTQVQFDLVFGQLAVPVQLPAECSLLTGIVTEIIEGTDNDDDIRGTGASELILGKNGHDEIDGGGGHDCIIGGAGNDVIDGGSGNDIIIGGEGDDSVDDSSGLDIIYGNEGNDYLDGGTGVDYVYAGNGNDEIDGSDGDDFLYGEAGLDTIGGGSGNDSIYGGDDSDTIKGGSDNDTAYGENGDDILSGGSGNDMLDGGPGNDSTTGNSGTDTCIAETKTSCEL